MKIEEIIKKEEKKGFFSKAKNFLSPRNLILTGCLLYTSLIGINCNSNPNENQPPVLNNIADVVVNEGELVKINPTATDPDNDPLTFSYTPPLNINGEWQTIIMIQEFIVLW